jgi:hypothetical protein
MSYATSVGGSLYDEVDLFTEQLAAHIDRQATPLAGPVDYKGLNWAKALKAMITEMRSMLKSDPPDDPEDATVTTLMGDELGTLLLYDILERHKGVEIEEAEETDSLPGMSSVELNVYCADPEKLRRSLSEWGALLDNTKA